MTKLEAVFTKHPLVAVALFAAIVLYSWRQIYTAKTRGFTESFTGAGRLTRGEGQFGRSLFAWYFWLVFGVICFTVAVLVALAPHVSFLSWVK